MGAATATRPLGTRSFDVSLDERAKLAHLYRRAGWGATKAELDAAVVAGYRATVETFVTAADPAADAVRAPILTPAWLFNLFSEINAVEELQCTRWWLERAVVSRNPLREKLPWFWHNLLTSSAQNARPVQMYQQNLLFRNFGWDNVEELFARVSLDPAMLQYLNLAGSHKSHPNENYARELLELFGVGRTGPGGVLNYTENDIKESARAMTGWSLNFFQDGADFTNAAWDSGTKTYLGQTGNWNLRDIIRITLNSAASKRWIPTKVWGFFAHPISTGSSIVTDLANGYSNSEYNYSYAGYGADLNMRNLLRAVFLHPEFHSTNSRTGLFRSPVEWSVAAFKYLQIPVTEVTIGPLKSLEQIPFRPPNVAGWPPNSFWITTASFLNRGTLAASAPLLGNTQAVDSASLGNRVAACAELLGVEAWSPTTASALGNTVLNPKQMIATALMSPEFSLS